ncbi:MAG: CubicO group peptidase (beta-lactamase class C family) [Acidimicrobiales bacterium]
MSGLAVGDPAALGFDPQRLAAIDSFLDREYVQAGRYPGYTLLVSRGGQIAHLSCQNYAEDAIFRFFSMSKPITSVALLSLYEQGLCKLGDPVSDFIPAFADLRVFEDGTAGNYTTRFPEREMTVQDLLTHTSGLTYGFMGRHPVDAIYRKRGIDRLAGNTLEDMCTLLADVPLLFSPGTQWSYSVATDVCGRLVEIISGQSLDEFFQQNIFDPLGMVDTGFWVDDDKADRLVSNYAEPSLSPFGVPEGVTGKMAEIDDASADSIYRSKPDFLSGGGGLVSTVADYHRFTQMLLRGGELDGHRVIGRKTLDYATTNHLPTGGDLASMGQAVFSETNYNGIGFGLGFSVMLDPAKAQVTSSPGEYGWGGAASTVFWVDPAEDLAVIGLTQLMPSSAYPIRTELKAMVYGALT